MLSGIYALELLIAATVLAIVPYAITRGIVTRIARWPAFEGAAWDKMNFIQGIAGTLELFHWSCPSRKFWIRWAELCSDANDGV